MPAFSVGGWLDQHQGSERLSSGVGSIWYYHYRFVRTRVADERERRLQRGANDLITNRSNSSDLSQQFAEFSRNLCCGGLKATRRCGTLRRLGRRQ
jgi:hypothetical protein